MAEHADAEVEVVYAFPGKCWAVSLPLTDGLTAGEAAAASGLLEKRAEKRAEQPDEPLVLGVFGVRVGEDHRLRAGDRVEICRPLVEDPREMRRHSIEAGRVMGQVEGPDS